MSDTTVVQALARAMRDAGAVGKDSRNNQQGFNFRGVDAVVNAVAPALNKHGIVVMPTVLDVARSTSATKSGGTVNNVYVTVRYDFLGPAGDSLSATVVAESFDAGDKGTAKAMSVAFRTVLLQALCLPTDDPDPDTTTYERGAPPTRAPSSAPPDPRPAPVPVEDEMGADEGWLAIGQLVREGAPTGLKAKVEAKVRLAFKAMAAVGRWKPGALAAKAAEHDVEPDGLTRDQWTELGAAAWPHLAEAWESHQQPPEGEALDV